MEDRWADFADALESSDSKQVNDVIDEINDMSLDERFRLLDTCFDDLTHIYANSDDGYVRQAVVRTVDKLWFGFPMVAAVESDDRTVGFETEDVRNWTDTLCGFLLEALIDEDGRVRNATKRALKEIFRTYDLLGDEETIQTLAAELDEMAAEYSGKRRTHPLETKEEATFHLHSDFGQLMRNIQEQFGDSLDSEGGP